MRRAERIESIRRRFRKHPEWLLIRVNRIDRKNTIPLTGRLLAHDSSRDVIFRKSLDYRGLILIDHSQEKLPEGYAVAF